jgi:hypothetical protein
MREYPVRAYAEARRREREAKSKTEAQNWSRVTLAIAHKTCRRVGLDTVTRMASDAIFASSLETSASPAHVPIPELDPVDGGIVVRLTDPALVKRHGREPYCVQVRVETAYATLGYDIGGALDGAPMAKTDFEHPIGQRRRKQANRLLVQRHCFARHDSSDDPSNQAGRPCGLAGDENRSASWQLRPARGISLKSKQRARFPECRA